MCFYSRLVFPRLSLPGVSDAWQYLYAIHFLVYPRLIFLLPPGCSTPGPLGVSLPAWYLHAVPTPRIARRFHTRLIILRLVSLVSSRLQLLDVSGPA